MDLSTEDFWKGSFGNEYISRNLDTDLLNSNINLFSKILSDIIIPPKTILELGANIGMNIRALKKLLPETEFTGVDINLEACKELASTGCKVVNSSINELRLYEQFDLVLTKTVLIHIDPKDLQATFDKIYNYSKEWILVAEYFNTTPVEVEYRGHSGKLFKRDFAGDLLNTYKDLKLVKYGFAYSRDHYPQDDITWFLLRKSPVT
jgi:spore coat polysaccharide biosynthesis protein SpsF